MCAYPTRCLGRRFLQSGLAAVLFLVLATAPTARAQTTIIWGGTSGSWNLGANWNGGVQPGTPDTAQITTGNASVDSNVSIAALLLSGGGISGLANLTLTGAGSTWSAGDMNSAGTTTIASGGTLAISTAANHDFNTRALVNQGTVNWTGGLLRSGNGGSITNNATWNDAASSTVNNPFGGAFTFTNASGATYNKTAAGTTLFQNSVGFNNSGAVNVTAGTLELNGGGTAAATGVFNTSAGALTLFSNNYTLASGAALTGAGTYQVSGGTLDIAGTLAGTNLTQTGGVLAGTQTFGTGSVFNWTAGDWNTAGTTTIASGGTLAISTAANHDFNTRALVNNGTVN